MADSAGTGQQNVRMSLNSAVANASKARPEIPRSSTKVARLDGRKAVSLETEIRVSPDGSSDLEVIDSGSPR